MHSILVVEDEELLRRAYGIILSTVPYDVHLAIDGKQALEMCGRNVYDLILLDLMMPEMNGVEFMEKFAPLKPEQTKIIMLSNVSSSKELTYALKLGAEKSALKASLSPKQLLAMIRDELETR